MDTTLNRRRWLQLAASASAAPLLKGEVRQIANQHFAISVDQATGALTGLLVKRNGAELVSEKRLAANFRLCVPLPDYLCNYVDGVGQQAKRVEAAADRVEVEFSGMRAEKGEVPIDLSYSIRLDGDTVRFRARLANRGAHPVSEFWFPRIGGWNGFGGRAAKLAKPNYTSCRHEIPLFERFPGERGLGSEAAEYSSDYPGMVMPWWDLYDEASKTGLYLGYHDKTFRYSTWHTHLFPDVSGLPEPNWLTREEAAGAPIGMVFSHVRYPFIGPGETYETGEFVLRVHEGDWHQGSLFYREWFLKNFPFDKSQSWLRKQSAWFSSIVYQPEDRVVADFATYDKWCQDAEQYGIRCHELIGWHRGGLERNYPEYVPEEKLGGRPAFQKTLKSIRSRGSRCLAFVNYNIVDGASDHYKRTLNPYVQRDQFGQTRNNMAWGESTLIARKGFSVRRHMLLSIVPPVEKLLEDYFVDIARDGADGLQIDKVVACTTLDFNPLNTRKPDEALCEGQVQAIARALAKCRTVNADFQLASEAHADRFIPLADVYYRAADKGGISPLRYVFPEWTSTLHVTMPRDFLAINMAIMTGAVICVEPELYQNSLAARQYRELAEYIREVERIRREFAEVIFLGDYFDDQLAVVSETGQANAANIRFAVHGDRRTKRKAIVVVNRTGQPRRYNWRWLAAGGSRLTLHEPFLAPREVSMAEPLEMRPMALHILLEH
jgi:hypothetical protein